MLCGKYTSNITDQEYSVECLCIGTIIIVVVVTTSPLTPTVYTVYCGLKEMCICGPFVYCAWVEIYGGL